jgi:hypothetical protein
LNIIALIVNLKRYNVCNVFLYWRNYLKTKKSEMARIMATFGRGNSKVTLTMFFREWKEMMQRRKAEEKMNEFKVNEIYKSWARILARVLEKSSRDVWDAQW